MYSSNGKIYGPIWGQCNFIQKIKFLYDHNSIIYQMFRLLSALLSTFYMLSHFFVTSTLYGTTIIIPILYEKIKSQTGPEIPKIFYRVFLGD